MLTILPAQGSNEGSIGDSGFGNSAARPGNRLGRYVSLVGLGACQMREEHIGKTLILRRESTRHHLCWIGRFPNPTRKFFPP